jgi:histidine triad (HIT) family protein
MKKVIISFFTVTILLIAAYFGLNYIFYPSDKFSSSCPFCNRKIIDYQNYYEDNLVIGLYNFNPVVPGHCLIIPKRHVERFEGLKDDEELAICDLIKKTNEAAKKVVDAGSYLILQRNGKSVGQGVPHIHFHYVPRKADNREIFGFYLRFVLNRFMPAISPQKMEEMTGKFRAAIKEQKEVDTPIAN